MKKLLVTLVVSLLFVWPLVAGAQQQGRPSMGEPSQPKGDLQQQKKWDANKPLEQAQMRDIETRLKSAGFDPGPVDGTFTAETDKALRDYQKKHGLRVTGLIGDDTLKELMATQARTGATPGRSPSTERPPTGAPSGRTMPSEPTPGGSTPGGTTPGGTTR